MLKKIKQIFRKNKVSKEKPENNNPRMQTTELSQSLLDTISVGSIIYAEYAVAGAMGCAGQAIIYIFEEEKLVCYKTNLFDDEDLYRQVKNLLSTHSNEYKEDVLMNTLLFDYYYGGAGNHVYINKNNTLEIVEDYFVYTNDNKNYNIYSSVFGVFDSVVGAMQHQSNE